MPAANIFEHKSGDRISSLSNFQMKNIILVFLFLPFFSCKVLQKSTTDLNKVNWIKGSEICEKNTDPLIQIERFNYNTYIFRQNKCVNYEAPFMFLFLGNKKALLMDTGATEDENKFPLEKTVSQIIKDWENATHNQIELIVAHTHNHGDHKAGDVQFKNRPATTIVGLKADEVAAFFQLDNWPLQNNQIDLGNRVLDIIPIPGHEKASIAVYDRQTKLLLSGDSFYPGRLYIRDWSAFQLSIQRLVNFTEHHKVSYILGNHIEMNTTSGKDYPTGTTFQPEEHALPLTVAQLRLLNNELKNMGTLPALKILDDVIIYPVKG